MNEKPLVSVICITYGHEDYIAQALDSFLMQKTTFPYQILVGEDKGPDRTAEIVLDYAAKYPDKIKPFIREKNMGAQRNLIDLCRRAGTEYVAFCEGDDFWTDEYKLQKQFDLMEEHPEYRACFHNTMIMADQSWYLYNYYIKDDDGNISLPESIPNYDTSLREMRMDYYIKFGPAHTSSLFYRWDNSRDIPEWYYNHIYGDHSLVMIQVGDGLIGYIPETMSVYRRSEVGVLMYENKTDHFLKSRESWIRMAVDIESYFKLHYNMFANKAIRERIVQEFNNYVRYITSSGNEEALREVYDKFAYPASLAAIESANNKRKLGELEQLYTRSGLNLLLKDEQIQKVVSDTINKKQEEIETRNKKRIKERLSAYVKYAEFPKEDNVWIFSNENRTSFEGNVKHLFEYIIAYHPEIKPVWLTTNKGIIRLFEAENMPCTLIGSDECIEIMKKASVAFVNNYKTKAYKLKGYNSGLKLVRLGNGVTLTDFSKDPSFEQEVQLAPYGTAKMVAASDKELYNGISITENNGGYLTEEYDRTFLQIAPNKAMAEVFEKEFGIPEENILISGSPRSFAVTDNNGDFRKKILLAPGTRYSILEQEEYFARFFDNLENINALLEETDTYLEIFLSNKYFKAVYKKINERIDQYDRMAVFWPGYDIYRRMRTYSLMITDWSETMFDFVLQDKPVVIYDPEADKFESRSDLLYDIKKALPGERAVNWSDAIALIKERLADPSIDSDKRKLAVSTVYDTQVSDDCSEKIIEEVKKRIGFHTEQ